MCSVGMNFVLSQRHLQPQRHNSQLKLPRRIVIACTHCGPWDDYSPHRCLPKGIRSIFLAKTFALPELPTEQQIRTALLQDVLEAKTRNYEVTREFDEVMGQIPSGLPHDDGVQRITNASNKPQAIRSASHQTIIC